MIALPGVSSGTPPPIKTAYLYPEIGDLGGRGRKRKRAIRRLKWFRESWDPGRCVGRSGLGGDALESFPGLGPRRFTVGNPFPQPHLNPCKQENRHLENTTMITTAVQNHQKILKLASRSVIRTNYYIYKILINYKGKTTTLGWRNLPELPQPSDWH